MYFLIFIIATLISVVLIPPLMRIATPLKLIDSPNTRKMHVTPIPRIGGIAIVVGAILPLLIWLELNTELIAILAGGGIIAVFGVWDDRNDLNYKIKFFGQILAVLAPIFLGDLTIKYIPFGPLDGLPDYLAIPVTIVFLIGITNAINLSDGLDGLAAGTTLISLGAIAILAYLSRSTTLVFITLSVCGGIFGFLRFNTHPAKIFMGDTGSQFLGYALGILAIYLTQNANHVLSPMLLILLAGLPILDTTMVMAQRIKEGRSPFAPDKNHLHHKLISVGLMHYQAVSVIYLLQLVFVSAAIILKYESDAILLLIYVLTSLSILMLLYFSEISYVREYLAISNRLWKKRFATLNERYLSLDRIGYLISIPFSGYLLLSPFTIGAIPGDIQILAIGLLVLVSLRLSFGYKVWFLFLRLLVYMAIILNVYLTETYNIYTQEQRLIYEVALFSFMACAALIIVKYKLSELFSLTPTDVLIMIALVVAAFLPDEIRDEYSLINILIKVVILLYCSEVLMKLMKKRVNLFTGSCFFSLLFLVLTV